LKKKKEIELSKSPKKRNTFVGTANNVSPELLQDENEIGQKADLWALGCIYIKCLLVKHLLEIKQKYWFFRKFWQENTITQRNSERGY